ncbi:MAG TPA: fumarate hydratase C-terminal domain-containing protein, partial [Candidatus Cloacimonadota bacterium]|nr:fumarate hydratase C-terminal domain-containing protein [Candidatus Cloacimonadota bacterium]
MSSQPRHLTLPLDSETLHSLRQGENYLLSGEIFTARDQAHKRMISLLEAGNSLPLDLRTAA